MAADSLKVVVYVPAGAARTLRARGDEPAAWVRARMRDALRDLGRPSLTVETSAVAAAGLARRDGVCAAYAPAGTTCKLCGKVHK